MKPVDSCPSVQSSTRSMVMAGLVALVLLVGFGVAGYLRIHHLTRVNRTNAAVIGLASQQRMLLHETALIAQQMLAEASPQRIAALSERLGERITLLGAAHEALLHGEVVDGVPGDLPAVVSNAHYEAPWFLEERVHAYLEKARKLTTPPPGASRPDAHLLEEVVRTATHGELPLGLDEVVGSLQRESEEGIEQLLTAERWALPLSFLILIGTGLFVFAPMVRRVRHQMRTLSELNATLEERVANRTREISDAANRTEAILDSIVEAIITIDEYGVIEGANPGAERIFGYTQAEMIGRNVSLLMPQPHAGLHDGYLERYRAGGEPRIIGRSRYLEGVRKDGMTFPMELAVNETVTKGRRLFTGILRDITQRRQAERALRIAKEVAEAANRTKSEFLANMSHEIRTPMNGIIGMTELALDTDLTREQREYLTGVKQSADVLLHIINDILDFSKIEAGKLELEEIPFGIRETVGNTMKALAVRAHQKGLELMWEVSAGVPDALVGDPLRVRQILVNLVGNAIKFTEQGEIVVRVDAGARTEGEIRLKFAVHDTGIGIPDDRKRQIFNAFAQADASTTRRYGGTGLGLAISGQLVTMMGGSIDVSSEEGAGSVFRFDALFVLGDGLPAETEGASPEALRELRVLVVDDNATNRMILGRMLESWGMHPTIVESGAAALGALAHAVVAGTPFPLVLLDYHMPEMDGLMVAERIAADDDLKSTHVLLLTSGMRPGRQAQARAAGVAEQLVKPVTQSELLDAVLRTIGPVEARRAKVPTTVEDPLAGRQLKVLLAEDNVVNQKLAVHMLEKRGHEVRVVPTGKQAVDALVREAFDVVLMDVQMPEMDGYEATQAIRESERTTGAHQPIVAMTAHAMEGDRERCIEAGMDEYVSKPIDAERLLRALGAVLEGPLPAYAPPPRRPAARPRWIALPRSRAWRETRSSFARWPRSSWTRMRG